MSRTVGLFVLTMAAALYYAQNALPQSTAPAWLDTVRQQCSPQQPTCAKFDAIVFVHGIYGGPNSFTNSSTHFDWPAQFPTMVEDRPVDVFRLEYKTAMLSWARGSNPGFEDVTQAAFDAMKPLRKRQYRSIGFVAHSLGGNLVSAYIVMLTERFSHPQRSQNAFVITLATPVLGAQIADLADPLRHELGMRDPMLLSLENGNLFLEMLNRFREEEVEKAGIYGCRPVHLHAAYEKEKLGPLLVVTPNSAALSVASLADSPIVGFDRNHIEIAKPTGPEDVVYKWAMNRISDEYIRLGIWDELHASTPANRKLCEGMDFKPES